MGSKDLQGDLIIAKGAKLTIRCNVSLASGAKVIVEPGGELALNGGRLYNACDEQWQGIEIQKEGTLTGVVSLLNNGKIEDTANEIEILKP